MSSVAVREKELNLCLADPESAIRLNPNVSIDSILDIHGCCCASHGDKIHITLTNSENDYENRHRHDDLLFSYRHRIAGTRQRYALN